MVQGPQSSIKGPLLDLESARALLKEALQDWEWFIAHLESEQGHFRFPKQFADLIGNLRIERYPLLYEKGEAALGVAFGLAFMSRDELQKFDGELVAATPSERGRRVLAFCGDLEALSEEIRFPETEEEVQREKDRFAALSTEDQAQGVRFWQFFWMGYFSIFHQYLSLMVHGEKLTALVSQAMTGSASAFAKAVQIDKRILTAIPHFSERFERAGTQGDSEFLDEVGRRVAMPPYKGKIRHKSLWMTFAVLDSLGLLRTLSHREILDFCDSVGVGGYKNRIEDVGNLSKRLRQYFEFQERGMVVE
jgi:hypothetical protein